MELSFALNEFKIVYILVTTIAWALMGIFAPRYMKGHGNEKRFVVFSILTLIGTLGVFFAGDLLTLFMFFELMSMASYVWVAQEESNDALRAGDTYMAVAVIGGLVLLMGIFLLKFSVGTLDLSLLKERSLTCENRGMLHAAAFCMLFGFGAKAGAFPLHIWLPKAHPIAPAPASALLSGILTKTGVYGIILVSLCVVNEEFWGWTVMTIAIITMVVGALLAVFSTNLKRTLACSSVSQIGFILAGVGAVTIIGAEGGIGLAGSLIHMINHSVIKMVLFLCAGVVYQNLHNLELNRLRGYGRKKPFLLVCFLLGALGIGGVPGFNGYISKTLIHEAMDECLFSNHMLTEIYVWIFVISGGLTVAYMTKLFVCIFVEKNTDMNLQEKYDEKADYMSFAQMLAIGLPAVMIPVIGLLVKPFTGSVASYGISGFGFELEKGLNLGGFFHGSSLLAAAESIAIGVLIYLVFIRRDEMKHGYRNLWPQWLDIEDGIYRPLLLKALPMILGGIATLFDRFVDTITEFLRHTVYRDLPKEPAVKEMSERKRTKLENRGIISRTLSYGLMLSCIGLFLLLGYLLYLMLV